jgi:hypothetical protein
MIVHGKIWHFFIPIPGQMLEGKNQKEWMVRLCDLKRELS